MRLRAFFGRRQQSQPAVRSTEIPADTCGFRWVCAVMRGSAAQTLDAGLLADGSLGALSRKHHFYLALMKAIACCWLTTRMPSSNVGLPADWRGLNCGRLVPTGAFLRPGGESRRLRLDHYAHSHSGGNSEDGKEKRENRHNGHNERPYSIDEPPEANPLTGCLCSGGLARRRRAQRRWTRRRLAWVDVAEVFVCCGHGSGATKKELCDCGPVLPALWH